MGFLSIDNKYNSIKYQVFLNILTRVRLINLGNQIKYVVISIKIRVPLPMCNTLEDIF